MNKLPADPEIPEEKPPGFQSWKAWYALVLGVLAILIAIFHGLTVALS